MFSDHVKILVDGAFFSLNMQVIFYNVLFMKPLEKMNTISFLVSLESKGVFYEFSMDSLGFWGLIWVFPGGFPGVFQESSRGVSGLIQGYSRAIPGLFWAMTTDH